MHLRFVTLHDMMQMKGKHAAVTSCRLSTGCAVNFYQNYSRILQDVINHSNRIIKLSFLNPHVCIKGNYNSCLPIRNSMFRHIFFCKYGRVTQYLVHTPCVVLYGMQSIYVLQYYLCYHILLIRLVGPRTSG